MKKSILIGGLIVFVIALLAQTVFAGTYYYQGQTLYSDNRYQSNYGQYGNYGNNYGNYYGNSPNYYYQGQYQYVQPYAQGFPNNYFYRGNSPSNSYLGGQTWNNMVDYGSARIYEKITYERNEYYELGRASAYRYGSNYGDRYLNQGYYNYPSNNYNFDRYGRYIY